MASVATPLRSRHPPLRRLAGRALRDFFDDGCPKLAAALAYYTVFSLPPFFVLLMLVLGAVLDPADVRGALAGQTEALLGAAGGEIARSLLEQAERPAAGGLLATVLGGAALLLGATGALVQLQEALNRVWEVQPDPAQGGLRSFVAKRVMSLALLLGVAFLLLVSLAVSAGLSALGERATALVSAELSEPFLHAIDLAISFSVITVLFAAMLKVLPDAQIAWRDVWGGAAVTSVLFLIGKLGIGLYLGRSNPGQVYGAASSLAALLVWVYWASMIVLLGAELTQVWTRERRGRIPPEPGAIELREESGRAGAPTAFVRRLRRTKRAPPAGR